MKVVDCIQGTPEWMAARCGIPTASNFDKIVDTTGKPSKQRTKYLYQLAGERIAGKIEETHQNAAMLRGIEMESEARGLYSLLSGQEVVQVGLCLSEGKAGYGASPDGLIGEDGGVEIKCPLVSTHVSYLLANKLPSDYFQQVQGGLLVTGRKWWDFVSYYPGLRPLLIRVEPDKAFQKALKVELELFVNELDDIVRKIK
jgi:hypothetical protein